MVQTQVCRNEQLIKKFPEVDSYSAGHIHVRPAILKVLQYRYFQN